MNVKNDNAIFAEYILNQELSSVEFVRDYIALHFDGPILNIMSTPTIDRKSGKFEAFNPGFADALCACIGRKITSCQIQPSRTLEIDFSDLSRLKVPLIQVANNGKESATLFADGEFIGVW